MTQPNQRHSTRSSLDSVVDVVDIESGIGFRANVMNVSDSGVLLEAPMEPAMGAEMYVSLAGTQSEFKVLRIKPSESGFTVAAKRVA